MQGDLAEVSRLAADKQDSFPKLFLSPDHIKTAKSLDEQLNDFSALHITLILEIIQRLTFYKHSISEIESVYVSI
jgi:hypothetical protein